MKAAGDKPGAAEARQYSYQQPASHPPGNHPYYNQHYQQQPPSAYQPYQRDDDIDFSCGDHMQRFLALLLNCGMMCLGGLLIYAAVYGRFFSTFTRFYRSLDTSRPYCEGEECEDRIVEIEQLADIVTVSVASLGMITFLTALVGYRAASVNSWCCLRTHSVLMIMFLLCQLCACVGLVLFKDTIMDLGDQAWAMDIGIKARIGKGRNKRKVFVPPMKCAIQEALGCYGFTPQGDKSMLTLSSSASSSSPSLLFAPFSGFTSAGVASCSGAFRPPSGGLIYGGGDTSSMKNAINKEEQDTLGDSETQAERELCCPTPAQRVVPKIQFDPMDTAALECSSVVPNFISENWWYIVIGSLVLLSAQVLIIYNSHVFATTIASLMSSHRRAGSSFDSSQLR